MEEKMKKNYICPNTEIVRLKIQGSILDEVPVIVVSRGAKPEDSFGKEQGDFFDLDDNFDNAWGHNDPHELWE